MMLKAYVYYDSALIHCTPFSIPQLDKARVKLPSTFSEVDDPREADIFWIPIDLGHWEAYHGGAKAIRECLPRLPHWQGNERRHVAYFCSDGADPVGLPLIMFRQSFWKNNHDENVIAWPYAVDDFGRLYTTDFASLKYDVSFVGSKVSHLCRIRSFDSVLATKGLESFLDDSKMHWGTIEHTEHGRMRKELFVRSLKESALVLAARGGGLSCYRFFEAMSAGRVPVLLADDVALPHPDLIEWDKCIFRIPEAEAGQAGPIILEWLQHISDDELAVMGGAARLAWYQYLAPVQWDKMMERIVRERLGL